MVFVTATRFTATTYNENMEYRRKRGLACIYGSQEPISDRCAYGAEVFVFEMNNDTNRIEGVGLIRNLHCPDRHAIHANGQYNLYAYVGTHYISREQLLEHCNPEWLADMESLMFKGKSNLKRLTGIRLLTNKLLNRKQRSVEETEKGLRILFARLSGKKSWMRPLPMLKSSTSASISASAPTHARAHPS